jgi:predicted nucleic acid-binding protein
MAVALPFQRPRIFIDTGAFVAVYHEGDSLHEDAIRFREESLLQAQVEMFCSDYVVGETLNNLQRLIGSGLTQEDFRTAVRGITAEATFQNLAIDTETNARALEIIEQFPGTFSFIDATNLALMEREGIRNIFAFDREFERYTMNSGYRRVNVVRLPSSWQSLV